MAFSAATASFDGQSGKDRRAVFSSSVIPTIGRPTLSRAVNSVLDQAFTPGDFEVIVVNDSGTLLPVESWQYSERVRIINTNRRERSVARNTGAAVARGTYLHFLDDDDWLLPGGLECLWQLACSAGAAWLYGATQLVDRQGNKLIRLRHGIAGNCFSQVMGGEWIPLQSSLIEAKTFHAAGGFNPVLVGPEDIDLCRRIALRCDLAGTEQSIACVSMGSEGSTTDYGRHEPERRWAREKVLDESGVFTRLYRSTRASPAHRSFWYGRASRVYLTSAVWNLQHRRLTTAVSRVVLGVAGMVLAGRHLVSIDLWRGLGKQYESFTFARGFNESNIPE